MKKTFKNEGDVKSAVKEILKSYGAWYFMPVTYGYGKSGVPDFCCVFEGNPIFIETKFGSNKPTALQKAEMERLYDSGAFVFVINENLISVVDDLLLALHMGSKETARYNSVINLKNFGMFKDVKEINRVTS